MNKDQLMKEIRELEEQLESKKKMLAHIYQKEHEDIEKRCQQVFSGYDKFTAEELIFSASSRCPCGAGLAYPKGSGPKGFWDCADLLMDNFIKKGEPGSKEHTDRLPFMFYEIKSEGQPSANGTTTRPKELS